MWHNDGAAPSFAATTSSGSSFEQALRADKLEAWMEENGYEVNKAVHKDLWMWIGPPNHDNKCKNNLAAKIGDKMFSYKRRPRSSAYFGPPA